MQGFVEGHSATVLGAPAASVLSLKRRKPRRKRRNDMTEVEGGGGDGGQGEQWLKGIGAAERSGSCSGSKQVNYQRKDRRVTH